MKKFISLVLCSAMLIAAVFTASFTAGAQANDIEPLEVPQVRVVTVDGNGNSIVKADGYVDAQITITDTDGTELADSVQFKVRGNSTANAEKKAFTFKFEKKKDVLDMGSAKKWALLANAYDPTLLRNYIAFELAYELDLEFASKQRIAELYVDNVFKGCYTLMEPVEEGKERVNIDIDSNDGMKDFLLEYEGSRYEADVSYINIEGLRFAVSEPEEPNTEQLQYIKETMTDLISTLKNGTQDEIAQAIDIPSFAKFYIMNEFLKTVDFGFSSVFFYYKDGVLYAGPPWDYDLSLGNANADYSAAAANAYNPEGLYAYDKQIYAILCEYPWFMEEARQVLADHYDFLVNIGAEGGLIDELVATYTDVINRNYTSAGWSVSRWQVIVQMRPLSTYQANLDFLKNWATLRAAWMAEYFDIDSDYYMLGDADDDGEVTIFDGTVIQRYLAEMSVSCDVDTLKRNGNVDGDELDIFDVTCIQRYLADYTVQYPIGEMIR